MSDSDNQQDSENYGKSSYKKYDIHEGIVFCIELSSSMFQELAELDYKVQLVEILETLDQLMSQLVITRPGTGIGCYFSNCNKNDSKYGIYEFFSLSDINAKNMKQLSDLLEDLKYERTTLLKFLQFNELKRTPLESLFGLVQEQFLKDVPGQKAFNNKKVFLFTDNDTPPEATDDEAKSRLRHLVDDLNDNYINFTTFFIGREDAPFNDSFYSDILRLGAKAGSEFDGPNTAPISASYIKSRILRKQEIKRIMFQCPLILEEDSKFTVGIKGYTIISHEKAGVRYKLVYEKEEIRKEAFSRRKYLDSKTGEDIKEGLMKVFPYGDLDINLTNDDLSRIKKAYAEEDSFLKVIGFRSIEHCIHYFNNIDKATFVVPDESSFEGSVRTLSSLFKTLKRKGKAAVVWGKLKSNSNPAVFVLCPSDERSPNEGFYLYRVPFLDELRRFPAMLINHNTSNTADYQNMKEVTKNIMGYFNLKSGYEPSEFKNPTLQKHFKLLHDYLLQIEEEPENDTLEGKKSNLLAHDDSLRKLSQIREKIIESANSNDPQEQRMNKYLNIWNNLYNEVNEQTTTLEEGPKPSIKKSRK